MSILFFNGQILTTGYHRPIVNAMLVRDGKIAAIGDVEEFRNLKIDRVNLEGRTVIPGFNDSHLHLVGIGETKEIVDLSGVESIGELQERLKDFVSRNKQRPESWIEGRGWNQNNFTERELPDRKVIDLVLPDYPVFLKRTCGHIALANSMALQQAGIDSKTLDPAGGKIDRDSQTGEPTGILRENAMELVEKNLPRPGVKDFKRWILKAADELVKVGLTSVQTDDFGSWERFKPVFQAYQELKSEGRLPLRINLQVRMVQLIDFIKFVEEMGLKTGNGDKWLKIGPCKILADGSMGGRTAALSEPYADDLQNKGTLLYEADELRAYIKTAHQSGFQPAVHGIGDRAISKIIDIYQEILVEEAGTAQISIQKEQTGIDILQAAGKIRPRIIHGQLTNMQMIERIKNLGIVLDIQPIFLNSDLHIAESRLGTARLKGAYAWRTMYDLGIHLGGGSDAPVDAYSPFAGIYSAVTRQDLKGYPAGGWMPEEKLDIMEALEIYTSGSAYNSFEEDSKGTLEAGKLADFIILNQNPVRVSADEIKNIEVLATYVGGKKVYSNDNG